MRKEAVLQEEILQGTICRDHEVHYIKNIHINWNREKEENRRREKEEPEQGPATARSIPAAKHAEITIQ